MRRSEINTHHPRRAWHFMTRSTGSSCRLSPTWTPEDWEKKGAECSRDRALPARLGHHGFRLAGQFQAYGLLMFTIRNGTFEELKKENGKIYAEKILIAEEEPGHPDPFPLPEDGGHHQPGGRGLRHPALDNSTPEI